MITLISIMDDLLINEFESIDDIIDYFKWPESYGSKNTYTE